MSQENYIEASAGFKPNQIPLKKLYDKYKSDKDGYAEIMVYSVWLQRLKQESKWKMNEWLKARSYLYRLFSSGEESKTTFTVVAIDLLIIRLKERIEFLSPDQVIGNIFKMMIDDLEAMKAGGCKYILLDGQNRLEYPIKRFFEGDLAFHMTNPITNQIKTINFVIDGQVFEKASFKWDDLSDKEQTLIENIQVVLAVGSEGEIDEFIEDLIDDNSGEHWNDFERSITSLRTICYLVNSGLSSRKGNVPEFKQVLDRVGSLTGAYHPEKKGLNKILCELIQFDYNGNFRLDYEVILDETKRDKITESFENVKTFFQTLAKEDRFNWTKGTQNVFESKEMLRGFYILLQTLQSGECGVKVPLDKIDILKTVYDDFAKFDNHKRDRKKNASEYTEVNGTLVPLPNTWIWAQKDIRSEQIEIRKKEIVNFVSDNIERWKSKHVFARLGDDGGRNEVTSQRRQEVILNADEDIYSAFGQGLNRFVDEIHVDHRHQFGRGGSNEVENLGQTTDASNLARVK